MPPGSSRRRSTLIVRVGVPVALVAGGIVLEVALGGVAGVIGAGLIGVALVLGLANLFYEVGRSEDRERAAARRAASGSPASNGHGPDGIAARQGGADGAAGPSRPGRADGAAGSSRPGRAGSPRDWPPRGRRGPHR